MLVTNLENGNNVTVYLTDSYVSCGANAIDLSLQAISDLDGEKNQAYKQGIIANAQWKHVTCPETLGAGESGE
jgi:expansin (peptidoglycan-binding protein)